MGSHAHYKARGNAQRGGLKRLAGIHAGFASEFAAALGCEAERIVTAVEEERAVPFTACGSAEDPERWALSFLPDEFQKLRNAIA